VVSRAGSVLVVDDDAAVRCVIQFVLRDAGCTVHLAENGREALQVLEDREIDLVLLDENMPEMSGQEICWKMRSRPSLQHLPVIFLTGKAYELNHESMQAPLGVRAVLSKPFSGKSLAATVTAVLAEQSPLVMQGSC
jgi:CheY-like chemotaxis protein